MRIKEHPVLQFPALQEVTFVFEDTQLTGYKGEPIAAALHANGIKILRHSLKDHRPRGFFCAIGNCSSCLMEVNGEPNVRICVEELSEGMVVKRQDKKGSFAGGENT
ncbi:MAG: (2Fe-2S)-binding protein [Clostridia bacterium]|nr:(2Fe-2S)-binding protein [Clostridia bacterium]